MKLTWRVILFEPGCVYARAGKSGSLIRWKRQEKRKKISTKEFSKDAHDFWTECLPDIMTI